MLGIKSKPNLSFLTSWLECTKASKARLLNTLASVCQDPHEEGYKSTPFPWDAQGSQSDAELACGYHVSFTPSLKMGAEISPACM